MVLDVAVAGSVGVNGTMTQVVAQARKVSSFFFFFLFCYIIIMLS
ncbi:hypothetical protein E2C01_098616 [Portunus trituberculatus]|uniref:Uncharacterized protein n=1 Tax=Portunus trituberculatus TaxID=210409 RepID=A0A5B7K3D5_PORTR|nr:hypothetical protein [Portunus trituberculatus]